MLDKVNNTNIDNSKYFLNMPRCVNKNSSTFTHSYLEHEDLSPKQKAIILGTTALGMALPLAFWSKRAGFSLNPVKIFKTKNPFKDWALLKYKPSNKILEYDDAAKIITIATGSVAGGYAGGMLVDKEHSRAKKREVLSQLLGDVIVPITCVWAGAKTFKHFEKPLQSLMPKLKDAEKGFKKVLNTISENIPNAIATLGSLGVGIIAGNKVSNEINEKLYNKKVERGIKASDFAPHVDDLCLSISMVNSGSEFGTKLGRIIPLALLVPGYETGTAREK